MIGRKGSLLRFASWCVGTVAAALSALKLQRAIGGAEWTFYLIAIGVGLALVIASHAVTLLVIHRRVGLDTREVTPGVQAWELTAGVGIVPKWISFVGAFGICFLLAVPFTLIAALLR